MYLLKFLLYRIKWNLAYWIKFKSPVHLDLELNNTCNQSCLSCWQHDSKPTSKVMLIKDCFEYLREGAKMGIKSVKFNLRGEPLLCDYLVKAVKKASDLGYIDIMINTNGVLLDGKKARELSKAGLTTCIISVDSLEPETYCKIHNCSIGDFLKLKKNLTGLAIYQVSKIIKFKVKLNFHINRFNVNEIPSIKDHVFCEYFKPVFRFTEVRKGKDITVEHSRKKRKKKCPHMMRRLTITVDKQIYPCCVCYDEPQDIRLDWLNDKTLGGAWNCMKRETMIDYYKQGNYSHTCEKCTSGDVYG